ncbi:tRNA isopentenyl-2-thiomethyl-A-37 hydroxylase MiaE [Engelhardtia mirabilis]|uniref:tRNA-(MS[2]IO[6]A)-hydroxylase (MiaE) n=1 Tax=Engelhardtia mirabilis TaxID=2528011 RepID=A0A518BR28_9BACT|nr:tRNA-(MS[2]IO[6]A)-hydroxylase (MiaE) [Planctomycetes bacterium Pla133]QDV03760.1 tRNA-(MS[2]IO[6]A)-hydroxylase (MiaE) [Planctomycetes bacterium Pla86]
MLRLRSVTPPAWAEAVCREPLALLSDHAHCELRAAASSQALINRHTARTDLCDRLAAVAVEEMSHFRQVLALIDERGGTLQPGPPSPYVEGLLAASRRERTDRDDALLDRLLIAGLIEARSLERFELLAVLAPDAGLRALYADLGPSERGHAALFPKLARTHFDGARVDQRAEALEEVEAELLARLDFAPRMHSGAPTAG